LFGLAVLVVTVFVGGRADLRQQTETWALGWLQQRHEARAEESGNMLVALSEADAVSRATAVNTAELTRPQAAVAKWISRRYSVAPEPVGRLVQEAWAIGERAKLDPTLILAIIAIESRFNPFAQSSVGAQGLMQVMTRVHGDKYDAFGGNHAAFDPISNLKVGVQVLRDCIARAGGLEAGLRWYVGAANLPDDGGYIAKVLTEQERLKRVANGKLEPAITPNTPVKPTPPERIVELTLPKADEADPQQVALLR
jgi:soluble lytic murein transglycosylase-like protein